MGLFGKKKKKAEEEPTNRRTGTQRRSRRIVTPGGQKPGGQKPDGADSQRRTTSRQADSSAVVKQRPRPPSSGQQAQPGKPQPGKTQPQGKMPPPRKAPPPAPDPELDAGEIEIGSAELKSAAPSPAQRAPAVRPGAGKQPIGESPELEFSGSLGGGSSRSGDQPLLEFLVAKASLLNQDQAAEAQAKAQADDVPVDVACTRLGFIDEDQLVNALTQECWVPHLKVDKYEIRKKALDTISEQDAREFGVLPVDKLGSILNLAMVNPLDVEAIRSLESKTGLDIKKVVATRSEIEDGIAKYYGGAESAKEGGLDIEQDHESRRLTQMLSRGPGSGAGGTTEPAPAAAPTPQQPVDVAEGLDDIADIDDLLSADEAVKPAIVEPLTIDEAELEPDIEEDELEVVQTASSDSGPGSIDIGGLDLSSDEGDTDISPSIAEPHTGALEPSQTDVPTVTPSSKPSVGQPAAAKPAAPKPAPAGAGSRPRSSVVELVPVMEEEFQHAITHGKSRVFDKWVSLQTRNRILNAVSVESELEPLLHPLTNYGRKLAG